MTVKYREWFGRSVAGTEEVEEERVRPGRMPRVEATEAEVDRDSCRG
jgi:hypothetical protein